MFRTVPLFHHQENAKCILLLTVALGAFRPDPARQLYDIHPLLCVQ